MARRSAGSKIDLNEATQEQLASIEGISVERARVLLEARQKSGGFHSWEEVQEIPGVSTKVVEKLKQGASLLATDGAEASEAPAEEDVRSQKASAQSEAQEKRASGTEQSETEEATVTGGEEEEEEEEEEDEDEEEEVDDSEIEALMALAQMDSEAAVSYETAVELVVEPEIQRTLQEFAADHHRHVEDIGRLIAAKGLEPAVPAPPPDSSVFNMLESAIAALGTRPALMALIGTEQFTNATYQTALELVTDPEAVALLERNYSDEQRHVSWLAEHRDMVMEEDEATGANA